MFAKSLLVSHDGTNMFACGNWTSPCQTIRYAISISDSGDDVLIDNAQNKPYEECESDQKSLPAIQINKSLSFIGVNGTAVIKCKRGSELFIIWSPTSYSTRVAISNLILTTADTLIRCKDGSRFELVLRHCVFKSYHAALGAKLATFCSINILNCTFYGRIFPAIVTICHNLTAKLVGSTFLSSLVSLRTFSDSKSDVRWQVTKVFISHCGFYGQQKQMCSGLLKVSPTSAVVNITVELSMFKNHMGSCQHSQASTVNIYGGEIGNRTQTIINLNKLLFENNYCTGAMIRLIPLYVRRTVFDVNISNSMFKNTTAPLYLALNGKQHNVRGPALVLKNNTFFKTYKAFLSNIILGNGKYTISSCRFFGNSGGNNPYDAVVRVWSQNSAVVIFENCYFENSQARSSSTQIFAENKHKLFFYNNNTFNISQLDKERSIIIFTTNKPSGGSRNLRLRGDLNILCPYGYVIESNKHCQEARNGKYIECAYFSASCKLCPRDTYSVTRAVLHNNVTDEIPCRNCVGGGKCVEGRLTAKPNFWGYKTNQSVRFLQCPRNYCCQENDCVSYDRLGIICGQCPDGMSESLFSTDCIPNHKCGSAVVLPLMLSLCICYLLFFLYHEEMVRFVKKIAFLPRRVAQNSNELSSRSCKSSGLLKVLFYYYQIVHLLRNLDGSHKKKTLLSEIENVFSSLFNFIVLGVSSLKCPIPNVRPVEKQMLLHSMGFVLLGLLCILYILTFIPLFINYLRRFKSQAGGPHITVVPRDQTQESRSSSRFTSRIISAFTYISLLMYSSSTQICLSLLHCVPVGQRKVLFLDGNIECYQTFQYFFLTYMISSIIPFCLVPVLGSYLLKFGLIGINQFCAASIFPLPFCCFWMYLFLREWMHKKRYVSLERDNYLITGTESCNGARNSEAVVIRTVNDNRLSILRVLLGPFRDHQSHKLFRGCPIPWEGFLTFRRLSIITVLTFIYDNRLKMILVLTLCVAILISHMYVKPFHNSRDNLFETASLCTHIILCGLVMVRNLCYSGEVTSTSNFGLLNALHLLESILVALPMAIVSFAVVISLLIRLVLILRQCMQFVRQSMVNSMIRQQSL